MLAALGLLFTALGVLVSIFVIESPGRLYFGDKFDQLRSSLSFLELINFKGRQEMKKVTFLRE